MRERAPLSLVIAEDDRTMRAALVELVEGDSDLSLRGVARDAAETVALVREHEPDVLLLDLRMPGGGSKAAHALADGVRQIRIVVLSAQDDRATRRSLASAGVGPFLVKGVSGTVILDAIKAS